MFGVLPLQRQQRHPSQGAFGLFIIFSLIFFLLSLFSLVFLSYHFFTYIFPPILLELIFFTFHHSLGCFRLVSVFHSPSLVAFSFSYHFRVLRTGILKGLGLFLRFWVCARTCYLFTTLPTWAVQYEVFECFSLLTASNTHLHVFSAKSALLDLSFLVLAVNHTID